MNSSIKSVYNKALTSFNRVKENQSVKDTINFFKDTTTFKKTLILSLVYVFLFYLPFTFITLFLKQVVFFQLDYVYQFSTIVFDFRNRLMDLNFSTWDFKNGIGYDYFANFYYIPLDITLLPYFLFPFLSYSQLMWLSFIFKILLGTAAMCYLLKLYKMNHKTILLVSVLYGTADLFFAQNVFPSYTGLIYYIPLILIAIELIFQRKNYLVFSLVIFQIFLFNSYWSWGLSLFMAISLLFRTIFEFFTFNNLTEDTPYKETLWILFKSVIYYLLGLGMAAFFFLPTFLGIMQNEPRMELSERSIWAIFIDIFKTFDIKYGDMVYYKQFFKMLVPNLYMYSGFFHDLKADYWLTTNHVVIYSSIFSTFSLFFLILYPTFLAKDKLDDKQLKTFFLLRIVTIIATVMLFFPFTSYLFSLNSGPYLRWLVFYGFLLIINFAFIYEYKLFNKTLFAIFLIISMGYLIFSIQFNRNFNAQYRKTHDNKNPNIFIDIDENVAITMIVVFIVMLLMIIILEKYMKVHLALFIERLVGIGLIFSICTSPYFSKGVRHADIYGKEVNRYMKEVELPEYYTMLEFLFYDDLDDVETMQDMPYLFDFPVYNNFNIFHSLVNPYFTFYNTGHTRYFRSFDIPYLYYYYMDPSLFILSNSEINPVKNGMYDPSSELIYRKKITELESYLDIYKKEQQFTIGNGFTTYYDMYNGAMFDYSWLESIYVNDENTIKILKENNFKSKGIYKESVFKRINYTQNDVAKYDMPYYAGDYKEYPVNIAKTTSDVVIIQPSNKKVFSIDNDGNVKRCFSNFCLVPEVGLKSIVVDKSYPSFYTVDKYYLKTKTDEILKYSAYDVKINGNNITSKVDNDEPIIMTYKVGYAKGWSVYVDDKPVEAFPSANGQVSFIINDTGTHNIKLKYETPYLKTGLKITLMSFSLFGGLAFVRFYRGKKCTNNFQDS